MMYKLAVAQQALVRTTHALSTFKLILNSFSVHRQRYNLLKVVPPCKGRLHKSYVVRTVTSKRLVDDSVETRNKYENG